MKSVAIIPARHASSRFPGKPLVNLAGKPMIIWVAEASAKAMGRENVIIATDHEAICAVAKQNGFRAEMTPGDLLTGTDRVASVAQKVRADIYLNIQGDEPLLDPSSIVKVMDTKKKYSAEVICAMTAITPGEDPFNVNLPKVLTSEDFRLMYMSRLPVPGNKQGARDSLKRYKQVCIYAFDSKQLQAFAGFGRKGKVESIEDIEILRFFELGIPVRMCEVDGGSLAVDVHEDVPKVEEELRRVHGL